MNELGAKTLLCESCGYPLGGLTIDGECPECGRAVVDSLPSRRRGSAAQRSRTWGAWAETNLEFANRPREGFSRIVIERAQSLAVLTTSAFVAAVLSSTAWVAMAVVFAVHTPRSLDVTAAVLGIGSFVFLVWVVIMLASWVESLGIRFFGARRGWRVTRDVAAAVCAHAAVGWVAGGVFVAVLSLAGLVAGLVGGEQAMIALTFGGLLAGAAIGLLWFESLVYAGVRACRFANAPDADVSSVEGAVQPGAPGAVSESGFEGSGFPRGAYDDAAGMMTHPESRDAASRAPTKAPRPPDE